MIFPFPVLQKLNYMAFISIVQVVIFSAFAFQVIIHTLHFLPDTLDGSSVYSNSTLADRSLCFKEIACFHASKLPHKVLDFFTTNHEYDFCPLWNLNFVSRLKLSMLDNFLNVYSVAIAICIASLGLGVTWLHRCKQIFMGNNLKYRIKYVHH